jgi:TonB family protein
MSTLVLMLLVKSTAVLLLSIALARLMQSSPAAARHLVWLSALSALLILPLGLLLPVEALPAAMTIRTGVSETAEASRTPSLLPWAAGLWLLVALALLIRLSCDGIRAIRLVRQSRPAGRTANHEVRIAAGLKGPVAWSFGAGAILLPSESETWTDEQIDAAVRHEAAHVQRRDSWWLFLAELVCAFYWFHPLVWYAARRLRAEQEHAADDLVLQSGMAPVEYASRLVSMVRPRARREALLAGAGTASMLESRIKTILDAGRKRTMVDRRMFATAFAAALIVSLPLPALQAQRKVYKIGGGVTAPEVIFKQEPQYTQEARDAKIEGSVLLSVVIDSDGSVSDIRVLQSLDEGLDENAMAAVATWQFRPAEKDGQPVAVAANIQVNFRLL